MQMHRWVAMVLMVATTFLSGAGCGKTSRVDAYVQTGVEQLVSMQEEGGAWPYEGVYRVRGRIPLGYQIGGTSLVGMALLYGASDDDLTADNVRLGGLDFVLDHLGEKKMELSTANKYDVRIWGQTCALEYFCHLLATNRAGKRRDEVASWIPRLADTIVAEELAKGGWNYAGRRAHASFVTAPVAQALLLAREHGATVPDEVLDRAESALLASRSENGAFHYSGTGVSRSGKTRRAKLPGSIARSAVCETTLALLGTGSTDAIMSAVAAFHEHWDELEKRRKKTGTHVGEYGIAPYYFYYAHRYAAQAIEMLPEAKRSAERDRLLEKILRTRDPDGTWNDRVFPRSRNFGTAMVVLALVADTIPHPTGRGAHASLTN
jgi:hypothetical protein